MCTSFLPCPKVKQMPVERDPFKSESISRHIPLPIKSLLQIPSRKSFSRPALTSRKARKLWINSKEFLLRECLNLHRQVFKLAISRRNKFSAFLESSGLEKRENLLGLQWIPRDLNRFSVLHCQIKFCNKLFPGSRALFFLLLLSGWNDQFAEVQIRRAPRRNIHLQ